MSSEGIDVMQIVTTIRTGVFTTREQDQIRQNIERFRSGKTRNLMVPEGVKVRIVGDSPMAPVEAKAIRQAYDKLAECDWRPDQPIMEWLRFEALKCEFRDQGLDQWKEPQQDANDAEPTPQ